LRFSCWLETRCVSAWLSSPRRLCD